MKELKSITVFGVKFRSMNELFCLLNMSRRSEKAVFEKYQSFERMVRIRLHVQDLSDEAIGLKLRSMKDKMTLTRDLNSRQKTAVKFLRLAVNSFLANDGIQRAGALTGSKLDADDYEAISNALRSYTDNLQLEQMLCSLSHSDLDRECATEMHRRSA